MSRDSKVTAWTDRNTDTQTDRHDRKNYLPAYAGGKYLHFTLDNIDCISTVYFIYLKLKWNLRLSGSTIRICSRINFILYTIFLLWRKTLCGGSVGWRSVASSWITKFCPRFWAHWLRISCIKGLVLSLADFFLPNLVLDKKDKSILPGSSYLCSGVSIITFSIKLKLSCKGDTFFLMIIARRPGSMSGDSNSPAICVKSMPVLEVKQDTNQANIYLFYWTKTFLPRVSNVSDVVSFSSYFLVIHIDKRRRKFFEVDA